MLKPDSKMLLLPKLLPEENDAQEEKIDRAANCKVMTDVVPGLLHFLAPVYVIENKNGIHV